MKNVEALEKVLKDNGAGFRSQIWSKILDGQNVIAIQPLELPSWSEIEKLNNETSIRGQQFFEEHSGLVFPYPYFELLHCNNTKLLVEYIDGATFDFTEQGYQSACEWLQAERIKLIKQLCGVAE